MNNCPTCYQHTIASCTKTIEIANGLPPSATFTITFTDKFGSVFVTSGSSSSFGMLQIDTANLPPFLLNPHAGDVTVQFYSSCGPATLTFCQKQYTCILLHVVDVVGDDGSNNVAQLPCCPGQLQQGGGDLLNYKN